MKFNFKPFSKTNRGDFFDRNTSSENIQALEDFDHKDSKSTKGKEKQMGTTWNREIRFFTTATLEEVRATAFQTTNVSLILPLRQWAAERYFLPSTTAGVYLIEKLYSAVGEK